MVIGIRVCSICVGVASRLRPINYPLSQFSHRAGWHSNNGADSQHRGTLFESLTNQFRDITSQYWARWLERQAPWLNLSQSKMSADISRGFFRSLGASVRTVPHWITTASSFIPSNHCSVIIQSFDCRITESVWLTE